MARCNEGWLGWGGACSDPARVGVRSTKRASTASSSHRATSSSGVDDGAANRILRRSFGALVG